MVAALREGRIESEDLWQLFLDLYDGTIVDSVNTFPAHAAAVIDQTRTYAVAAPDLKISTTGSIDLRQPRQNRLKARVNNGLLLLSLVQADLSPDNRRKRRRKAQSAELLLVTIPLESRDEADALELALNLCGHGDISPIALHGPFIKFSTDSDTQQCDFSISYKIGIIPAKEPGETYNKSSTVTATLSYLLERVIKDATGEILESDSITPAQLLGTMVRTTRFPAPNLAPVDLQPKLLPFQRESVRWMLRREGKDLVASSAASEIRSLTNFDEISVPRGWRLIDNVWVNPYSLHVQQEKPSDHSGHINADNEFCGGGLLAEEMGLGKSLEIISLILLNKRNMECLNTKDNITPSRVKTTLVIAPQALLSQWAKEFQSHAPSLLVREYTRHTGAPVRRSLNIDQISEADVVLISYTTLSLEVYSAAVKPHPRQTRNARSTTEHAALRSPLVQLEFWRVVLDEVQMVHSGSSNAARVARMIPRVHAWGVTGTPIKGSMSDIRGIVFFLGLTPYIETRCWMRLLECRPDFERLFQCIGIRNTKPMVSNQLALPPQMRHIVPVEFTDFERYGYDTLWSRMGDGRALTRLEQATMLTRLRQMCCYISHGRSSAKHDTRIAVALDEAFARVLHDAEILVDTKMRAKCAAEIAYTQYLDKCGRYQESITILKSVLEELQSSRAALIEKKRELEEFFRAEEEKPQSEQETETESSQNKISINDKLNSLRNRIETLTEMCFRSAYFIATAYYRLRTYGNVRDEDVHSLETFEQHFYELAEKEREEITGDRAKSLEKIIPAIKKIAEKQIVRLTPSTVLEDQADLLEEIIEELLPLMITPLLENKPNDQLSDNAEVKQDLQENQEEAEAQMAYTATLEAQAKAEYLLAILKMTIGDRAAALHCTGFDVVTKRKRARYQEGRTDFFSQDIGYEDTSTWDDYKYELYLRRAEMQLGLRQQQPIFDSLSEVEKRGKKVSSRVTMSDLKEDLERLQQMYKILTSVNNTRISYYAQLQRLSDSVADLNIEPENAEKQLNVRQMIIAGAEREYRTAVSGLRYIQTVDINAKTGSGDATDQFTQYSKDNVCAVCREEYRRGLLTVCGHRFCRACLEHWLSTQSTCPLCKRHLGNSDLYCFFVSEGSQGQDDDEPNDLEILHLESQLYKPVSRQILSEIADYNIGREWGSKISSILGLVLWIKSSKPDTQIVVASQWPHMLLILQRLLQESGISAVNIRDHVGLKRFRSDKSVTCFMLNSTSNAAGLTLVNATHVLLCDPLISTAQELQAISRIHRIGQSFTTHVWQFCVVDTVEQAIVAVTAEKRVRHAAKVKALNDAKRLAKLENDVSPSPIDSHDNVAEEIAESEILGEATDKTTGGDILLEDDLDHILQLCAQYCEKNAQN